MDKIRKSRFWIVLFALGTALGLILHAEEYISPRTGRLILSHTDLVVQAGPVTIAVDRTLQNEAALEGRMGKSWRLNWEKRLIDAQPAVVIDEAGRRIYFAQNEESGEFVSATGDRLVFKDNREAVRTKLDGTSEKYDASGRLVEMDMRNGNRIALVYDNENRLQRLEGPRGSFIAFKANKKNDQITVTCSSNQTVSYKFSGENLTDVIVNGQTAVQYSYDDKGRIVSIADPLYGDVQMIYGLDGKIKSRHWANGSRDHHEYDEANRAYRNIAADGGMTVIQWSEDSRRIETTDPLGDKTVVHYDENGRPVSSIGPTGLTSKTAYDNLGRVVSTEGCCGDKTLFTYREKSSRVESIVFPNGTKRSFSYDPNGNLKEVKEGEKIILKLSYYPDGLLMSMEGKGLPKKSYTYDVNGRIASETNVLGHTVRYEYDKRGNCVKEIDSSGGMTLWEYDSPGRIVKQVDPEGGTVLYRYDTGGRLVEETDPLGGITKYTYDVMGRLVTETDPSGRTISYTYSPVGQLLSSTDHEGNAYCYEYDAAGNMVREVDPLGGVKVYHYDALGRMVAMTDALNRETQYEYNERGNLARVVGPEGLITKYVYDARGRRNAVIDPAGRKTLQAYDEDGQLSRMVFPLGMVREYSYDEDGYLAHLADNQGKDRHFQYDALGRIIEETWETGLTISYVYDASGNLIEARDSLGSMHKMSYDRAGRLISETDSAGNTTEYKFDAAGFLREKKDPLGRITKMSYTLSGNLYKVEEPNGDITHYEYDEGDRLKAARHPGGQITEFAKDPRGNLIRLKYPKDTVTQFSYDKAERLARITDPRGQTTQFIYDNANNLSQKTLPGGRKIKYTYDAAGNVTAIDDGSFPILYSYDDSGRLEKIEYPAIKRSVGYAFDESGLPVRCWSEGSYDLRYEYDKSKKLQAIRMADGKAITFRYDPKGRLIDTNYPNGVRGLKEYDHDDRIVGLSYIDSTGKKLASWDYAYDKVGNLVRVQDKEGKIISYKYDASGQITEEDGPSGRIQYEYLQGRNRKAWRMGDKAVIYDYDDAARLIKAGGETFTYDKRGNLVERISPEGMTRYSYDDENRLIQVKGPEGDEVSYGYAPNGTRIWRKDEKGLTYFVNSGQNLMVELDADFKQNASYVHAPGIDNPLMMLRDGKVYYYHSAILGSIALMTDSEGKAVAEYETDAFGRITRVEEAVDNPFRFTAREYESETGLYYFRARYYDPDLGRFLSQDPYKPVLGDPATLNKYAYVRNRPTKYTDPLGLQDLANRPQFIHVDPVGPVRPPAYGPQDFNISMSQWDKLTTQLMEAQPDLYPSRIAAENNIGNRLARAASGPSSQQTPSGLFRAVQADIGRDAMTTSEMIENVGWTDPENIPAPEWSTNQTKMTPGARTSGPRNSGGRTQLRGAGRGSRGASQTGPSSPMMDPQLLRSLSRFHLISAATILGMDMASCMAEGHSFWDCSKHTGYSALIGAGISGSIMTAGGLLSLATGGTFAGGIAVTGGALMIAGVPLALAGTLFASYNLTYNLRLSRINQIAVNAEENLSNEQQRHLQDYLPGYDITHYLNQLEAVVLNELAELGRMRAEAVAACQEVKDLANKAREAAKTADANMRILRELCKAITISAQECRDAGTIKSEIEKIRSRMEQQRASVLEGIKWAESRVQVCQTVEDAQAVRSRYNECRDKIEQMRRQVKLAQSKNEELKSTKSLADEVPTGLANAERLKDEIAAAVDTVGQIRSVYLEKCERAENLRAQFETRRARLRTRIQNFMSAFPSNIHGELNKNISRIRARVNNQNEVRDIRECTLETYSVTDIFARGGVGDAVEMILDAENLVRQARDAAVACEDVPDADDLVVDLDGLTTDTFNTLFDNMSILDRADECESRAREGDKEEGEEGGGDEEGGGFQSDEGGETEEGGGEGGGFESGGGRTEEGGSGEEGGGFRADETGETGEAGPPRDVPAVDPGCESLEARFISALQLGDYNWAQQLLDEGRTQNQGRGCDFNSWGEDALQMAIQQDQCRDLYNRFYAEMTQSNPNLGAAQSILAEAQGMRCDFYAEASQWLRQAQHFQYCQSITGQIRTAIQRNNLGAAGTLIQQAQSYNCPVPGELYQQLNQAIQYQQQLQQQQLQQREEQREQNRQSILEILDIFNNNLINNIKNIRRNRTHQAPSTNIPGIKLPPMTGEKFTIPQIAHGLVSAQGYTRTGQVDSSGSSQQQEWSERCLVLVDQYFGRLQKWTKLNPISTMYGDGKAPYETSCSNCGHKGNYTLAKYWDKCLKKHRCWMYEYDK